MQKNVQEEKIIGNYLDSPLTEIMHKLPPASLRYLLYLIVSFMIIFVIYAYFSEVDEIVKSTGKLVKYNEYGTKSVIIQAPYAGRLENLFVREGDRVTKDQVIAELLSDNVFDIFADIKSTKEKNTFLNKSYRDEIVLEEKRKQDIRTRFNNQKVNQEQEILRQKSIIKQIEEEKNNLNDLINKLIPIKYENQINSSQESINYYQNKHNVIKGAVEKGLKSIEELYDIKNRLQLEKINLARIKIEKTKELILTRKDLQKINEQIAQEQNSLSLISMKNPVDELENSLRLIEKESEKQKAQIKLEIKNNENHLDQLEKSPRFIPSSFESVVESNSNDVPSGKIKLKIKSTIDGYIENMKVGSIGEMVESGGELFAVSPKNAIVLSENYVPNKDIGSLENNMRVKMKFEAFPYQDYGYLEGAIWKISHDSVKINEKDEPYKVLVRFDDSFLRNLEENDYKEITESNLNVLNKARKNILIKQGLINTGEIVKEKNSLLEIFFSSINKGLE